MARRTRPRNGSLASAILFWERRSTWRFRRMRSSSAFGISQSLRRADCSGWNRLRPRARNIHSSSSQNESIHARGVGYRFKIRRVFEFPTPPASACHKTNPKSFSGADERGSTKARMAGCLTSPWKIACATVPYRAGRRRNSVPIHWSTDGEFTQSRRYSRKRLASSRTRKK